MEKDLSEEEKRNLALLSTFTGLLNKITPQNFARILEKVSTHSFPLIQLRHGWDNSRMFDHCICYSGGVVLKSWLCWQVLALPVSSESDLIGIVGLVAEKAIAEPAFSVTYANLCNKLSKVTSL